MIRKLHVGDFLEHRLVAPDLVGVVERRAHDALAKWLEHHHAFAARHHDARNADHLLLSHRVADDREGLLPDFVLRREIVGRVAVAVVNRGLRDELLDVNRV